jgi:hypothetical protein
MRELDKALADITAIRSQMARGTQFRGYGPATIALTGIVALGAGVIQGFWLEDASANIAAYIALWIAAAILSVIIVGIEMIARSRRLHRGFADEMIHSAIEQLIPAGAVGLLLTAVICLYAPHASWMLPSLWQLVFSLGLFASCRSLPRAMFAVPVWYLATGLSVLAFANESASFSPLAMALPFCIGQWLMAAILYVNMDGGDVEG